METFDRAVNQFMWIEYNLYGRKPNRKEEKRLKNRFEAWHKKGKEVRKKLEELQDIELYLGKNGVMETKEAEKFLLSLATISKYTEMQTANKQKKNGIRYLF